MPVWYAPFFFATVRLELLVVGKEGLVIEDEVRGVFQKIISENR